MLRKWCLPNRWWRCERGQARVRMCRTQSSRRGTGPAIQSSEHPLPPTTTPSVPSTTPPAATRRPPSTPSSGFPVGSVLQAHSLSSTSAPSASPCLPGSRPHHELPHIVNYTVLLSQGKFLFSKLAQRNQNASGSDLGPSLMECLSGMHLYFSWIMWTRHFSNSPQQEKVAHLSLLGL